MNLSRHHMLPKTGTMLEVMRPGWAERFDEGSGHVLSLWRCDARRELLTTMRKPRQLSGLSRPWPMVSGALGKTKVGSTLFSKKPDFFC